MTPGALSAAPGEGVRAPGLSAAKIRTLRAMAAAVADGGLRSRASRRWRPTRPMRPRRGQGIGPWTADVSFMVCLGHADAFAAGDLAMQEAADACGLEARPA